MKTSTIILVALIALVLVIYLFIRNNKDRKKMEKQMNEDYKKPVERKDEKDTEEGGG